MTKLKLTFAMIASMFLANCSMHHATKPTRAESAGPHRLTRAVEDLIASVDPNVNIGVSIRSLSSDRVVFEKNAARHFVPCSTIKIVTLAAALYYLGPSYRFTTKFLTDKPVSADGTINDLYIVGGGDPSLMDYDLVRIAQELAAHGIKKIAGHVVVDDQIFDDILWGRGDMWDDRYKGYAAPVSGLNLNYNRIQIKTMPAFERGHHAAIALQPKTRFVNTKSLVNTVDSARAIEISVQHDKERARAWSDGANDGLQLGDTIIVNGQMGKNANPHYATLAVRDPGLFAGTIVQEELERLGVKIHGKIERRAAPVDAIKLAEHESRSLAEALIDFTKISNNVAHDTLVKAIAAEAGIKPATASAGLKLIGDFLKNEVGIEPNSLVTADGAGLSRYNLITPEQMVKLLNYAGNQFHMGAEFMAALSFGGEDGLLKSRLTMEKVRGNIRAKSGNMSGLSNLVGILTDENGERFAFAIMINGFVGSSAPYIALQDRILTTMLTDDQTAVANVK